MKLKYRYLALAVVVTAILITSFTGIAPAIECPFFKFFRFCCPMCGTTRAWKSLIYLNSLSIAFFYNPLFIFWGFIITLSYLDLVFKALDVTSKSLLQRWINITQAHRIFWNLYCLVLIITMVYLNLPITRHWRELTDYQLSF